MTPRNKPHPLSLVSLAATAALAGCHTSDFPTFPDGFREFAYVANSGANTVTVLDLVYVRVDRTLRVGPNPIEVVGNPRKAEVYVLSRETGSPAGSVAVIDTSRNEVVATLPVRQDPVALSVDPTGARAFVANTASGSISILDLEARRTLASISTPPGPTSALISPDGRAILVTHSATGEVALYSAGLPGAAEPPLTLRNTYSGCRGATSPVILPDSSKAFIACQAASQIMSISLAAAPNSRAARHDSSLTADHVLALLDVGESPEHLILKPDGGELFVSNAVSGSITEVSTTTNEVSQTFGIGNRPQHSIVSADNSALWVANSGADTLSLYSIDDGKRLPSLHVGAAPDALAFTTGPDQHFLLVADRASGDVAVIRNSSRQAPSLLTILPAGPAPAAIAIQSNAPHR